MKTKLAILGALAAVVMAPAAQAQEVTLRLHQMLVPQATIPANAITPWIEKIEAESEGRISIEHYPAMQLGGAPPELLSQAQDGVVDIIWTVLGYTPGRFPKSEVFELPFLMSNGEETSVAFYNYVMANSAEEFDAVHVLALHTHGPGLFHTKDPVTSLDDLSGMKIRGGSRIISGMLATLGAEPIGMPVPQVTEALSLGVLEGTTIPWEVTPSLRVSELVTNHTEFAEGKGLYTQTFGLLMNKASYENLPDDLKAIIDANSGLEVSRMFGSVMDQGDIRGRQIAVDNGNDIVTLDAAETARWEEAAQPTIDSWLAEMDAAGIDGAALLEAAKEAIAAARN